MSRVPAGCSVGVISSMQLSICRAWMLIHCECHLQPGWDQQIMLQMSSSSGSFSLHSSETRRQCVRPDRSE